MSKTDNTPKTVPVNMRLPRQMVDAIAEAIKAHPMEFRTAADFYRTALRNELERRGTVKS
jgi:Arc/MetJ-type ribon-helix-helix transcriptional regulator